MNPITRFNFTYACDGGAWIERQDGKRNWLPWHMLRSEMGQHWIDQQLRKQGWMTGSWVTVDDWRGVEI